MFCSRCGSENGDAAKFCSDCGASLVPDSSPIPTPSERVVKSGNGVTGKKLLIFAGVVVIIGFVAAFLMLNQPETPRSVAEKYMNALVDRDYEEAYQYISSDLKISESVFVYTMKVLEKAEGPVKEYRIEEKEANEKNGDASMGYARATGSWQKDYQLASEGVSIPRPTENPQKMYLEKQYGAASVQSYSLIIGRNERDSVQLNVINQSTDDKPDWRVIPLERYSVTQLPIPAMPGMKVKLCGEELLPDAQGRYIYSYYCSLPVEVSSPLIKTVKTDNIHIKLELSDAMQAKMEDLAREFARGLAEYENTGNVEAMSNCLVRNSEPWKALEKDSDFAAADGYNNVSLEVIDIEPGTLDFIGNEPAISLIMHTRCDQIEAMKDEWEFSIQQQKDKSWKIVTWEH